MTDFNISNELDDDVGDFDAGASTNSDNDKVDSVLIKKILSEMKSEFNRGMCSLPKLYKEDPDDSIVTETLNTTIENKLPGENSQTSEVKLSLTQVVENKDMSEVKKEINGITPEINPPPASVNSVTLGDDKENKVTEETLTSKLTTITETEAAEEYEVPKKKPKLSKEPPKKPETKVPEPNAPDETIEKKGRRSLRIIEKPEPEICLKRSSRRMSKEYSRESVLQNAIARKEKSFSSLHLVKEKSRRSTRLTDDKSTAKPKSNKNNRRTSLDSESLNKSVSEVSLKILNGKTKNNFSDTDSESKKGARLFDSSNSKINGHLASEDDSSITYQPENEWEKGTDSSSSFSTSSLLSKKNKTSCSTDKIPSHKKARIDSSSITPKATNNVGLHSSDINATMDWNNSLCECLSHERFYPSRGSMSSSKYCRALDSFESRIIGCCNSVNENTPLLRPSKRIPLLLMCELHIERLRRHNCCPTCGLYCTQGVFHQCEHFHFFHKGCEMKKNNGSCCPHCGSQDFIEVRITLKSHQYPIFLPMQKSVNKNLARISLNYTSFSEPLFNEKVVGEVNTLVPVKDLLINKKKISTEGLPIEKEKLENLMHALSTRNDVVLRYSQRAFHQACKNGDTDKLLSMISSSTFSIKDTGSLLPLHAAAGNGQLMVVHILVQAGTALEVLDKSHYTALMVATLNGHNNIVKYLIKAGVDIAFKGNDGMTALHLAAKIGNVEACHYLLTGSNAPLTYVDCVDDGLWTPLVWAAENNHANVVRYLLEKKADPHLRDTEMNIALHWSAFSASMDITENLLNYGSAINVCNALGDTPLHIAARQAADNCVMLLLARGAKTDIKNKAGQLAKDCASLESSYCKIAIELSMKIKSIVKESLQFPKILSNDISRGHESNPIQCVNEVDEKPLPKNYTYITENCITSTISIDRRITTMTGCKCEDKCTTSSCLCSKISLRCWYDNKGKLLPEFNFKDPPMIFECNQTCECNAITCKNRVVQRGLRVKLQVCRTKNKEWGVITLKEIPKGSYVCEYIGEIISDNEADTREDDSYLFDLDNRDGESYCIDACKYGNVTRFVNHSCKPNLVPVRVFMGHQDLHFPRIAFFAARDIAPYEELGFDYGEKFWIIKYKKFVCECREDNCRYSSKSINETLKKYREKMKSENTL